MGDSRSNTTQGELDWSAQENFRAKSSAAFLFFHDAKARLTWLWRNMPLLALVFMRIRWRFFVVTACILMYLYPFLRVFTLPADEGWCITDAARVYSGQLPFRDFFEIVGPGTFYWIAIFFKLFGQTWLATRACVLMGGTATALLVYFLARRLKPGSEIMALTFWLAVSFPTWPAVNHHLVGNLFALMAFALAIRWLDSSPSGILFICGMAVGVTSSMMFQKGVLLCSALVLTLLLQRGRQHRLAAIVQLLAGTLSVAVAVVAYFWARGGLFHLIYANFVWPFENYSEVGRVSYGFGFADRFWALASVHPVAGFAIASMLSIPSLVVLLLPLILVALCVYFRSSCFNARTLPYLLVGSALWISEAHRPDMIHLVLASPVLIILYSALIQEMRIKTKIDPRQIVTIGVAIVASVNLLVCVSSPAQIATAVGSANAFAKSPVINFTNRHVKPGETIFIYPYAPIYYFLSGASNPTRFSYLVYQHQTRDQMLEVIGSLEKDKTRYVIWDTTFESVMAPAFLPSYRPPADRNRVIEPYLNEHYIQIAFENGFRFMERKSPKLADVAIAAATIQTTGQLKRLSGRHANLFVPARHSKARNKRLEFTANLGQARRTSAPGSEASHPVIIEPGL